MQELASQIADLEQNQRISEESFRAFAGQLGRTIAHLDSMDPVAPALRDEYLQRESDLAAAASEKSLLDELVKAQKEGRRELESLKQRRLETEKALESIRIRLGAIAFEQAQSTACSAEVKTLLAPIVSRYQRLQENSREGSFFSATTSKLLLALSNQDKDFLAACQTLEKADLLASLQGERAQGVVKEYAEKRDLLASLLHDLDSLGSDMGDASEIAEDHTKAVGQHLEECTRNENESAVSYGTYLFENMDKWLHDGTDEKIVDLVSDLMRTQEQLDMDRQQIQRKKAQIEIFNQMEKVRMNEMAIEKLEAERERLRKQIEDLSAENELLKSHVSSLQGEKP